MHAGRRGRGRACSWFWPEQTGSSARNNLVLVVIGDNDTLLAQSSSIQSIGHNKQPD